MGSILIWQRSAIASITWPLVSLIRSVSDMDGTTAYRSGRTPVQSNARSAISGLLAMRAGARPDAAEELGKGLVRLGAAVEAAPGEPHPPGEFVADVDRHEEMLDAVVRPADQGRLDVGFHRPQQRMCLGDTLPRRQVEPAFGDARRAR